jgi:hypothetical protein
MAPREPSSLDWILLAIVVSALAILALAAHVFPRMFS